MWHQRLVSILAVQPVRQLASMADQMYLMAMAQFVVELVRRLALIEMAPMAVLAQTAETAKPPVVSFAVLALLVAVVESYCRYSLCPLLLLLDLNNNKHY